MKFREEFEHEIEGKIYNVEVSGEAVTDYSVEIETVRVTDGLGNELEEDDPDFLIAREEAENRDYDLELHNTDFDTYDQYIDPLLGDI